MIEYFTTLYK